MVRLARGDNVVLHDLTVNADGEPQQGQPTELKTAGVFTDPDRQETTLYIIRQEGTTWVEEAGPFSGGFGPPNSIVFDDSQVPGLAKAGSAVEYIPAEQRSYLAVLPANDTQWTIFTWERSVPVAIGPWVAGHATFAAPPVWKDHRLNRFYTSRSGKPQLYDTTGQPAGRQTLGPLSREGHASSDSGPVPIYSVVTRERTLRGWNLRIAIYTGS
jgi:hypothetical protein